MGTIAGIAAIAAFIAAAVMLVLGGLGLVLARRTSPATEILAGQPASGPSDAAPHNGRPAGQQSHDGELPPPHPAPSDTGSA